MQATIHEAGQHTAATHGRIFDPTGPVLQQPYIGGHTTFKYNSISIGLWLGVLVVAALHARLFSYGYRLAADDVLFHYLALKNSLAQNLGEVIRNAEAQGRIGQFFAMPMNMLASDLVSYAWFRVAVVGLWYGMMLLFALWVGRLCRSQAMALMTFLVLSTCQRLGFDHMPPNSFPLQNTLPFLIILAVRLVDETVRGRFAQVGLRVILCLAMLANEFSLIFGLGILGFEYLTRWLRADVEGMTRPKDRAGLLDAAAVGAAIALYLGYRFAHPSHYDGNTPDGLWNVDQLAWTSLLHVLNGTVLLQLGANNFAQLPWKALVAWAGMSALTAIVAWGALRRLEHNRAWLAIALLAILFSFYVTLPVAMTAKYQAWCRMEWPCAYLDTRTAFLGLGVALVALCGWLIPFHRMAPAILAMAIGLSSGTTYLYNLHASRAMQLAVEPWQRADIFACKTSAVADGETIAQAVDPFDQVHMHPDFPRADYWRAYIEHQRSSGC